MKKSLTENRENITLEEFINEFVYNPYGEEIQVSYASGEVIVLRCGTWTVIMDHIAGDFKVIGELVHYYDIDRIKDLRDNYGEIYSLYNEQHNEHKYRYTKKKRDSYEEFTACGQDDQGVHQGDDRRGEV